jgi:hypothetical protein
MRDLTLTVTYAGLMFEAKKEEPSQIHEIELELNIPIEESVDKKDFRAQLLSLENYISTREINLYDTLISYTIEDGIKLDIYEDIEWMLISVENGNSRELYHYGEEDEQSYLILQKPLLISEKK